MRRGFGASGRLTAAAGYRVADLASDLVAVMEAAGFERFSVFGCSFTGAFAPWLAALAFYRELSELPPDFLVSNLPCPLFAFWGEEDEEIARAGARDCSPPGWTATGSSTRSSPVTTTKACWPTSMRRYPASWPGSTACRLRSERWVSRTGTLAKDSAHPACRRTARAHSSVEEHSPYKRRVTGSNPVAPTRQNRLRKSPAGRGHRQTEVALDKGRRLLESLPYPENLEHHFVVDPTKFDFYAMDCYRALANNKMAENLADEVIQASTDFDGRERTPMRLAEARITLGVIRGERRRPRWSRRPGPASARRRAQIAASLLMVTRDLTKVLNDQYRGEAQTQNYLDQITALTAVPATT